MTFTYDELTDRSTEAQRRVTRIGTLIEHQDAAISALEEAHRHLIARGPETRETCDYQSMVNRLEELRDKARANLAAAEDALEAAAKAVRAAEAAAGVDPADDARFDAAGTYIAPVPAGVGAL